MPLGGRHFGPCVTGVVLSGDLDDGTSGLWMIKRRGGTTVVQEPRDAAWDSMPLSAIAHVEIDHQLPAARIGRLLVSLTPGEQVREHDGRERHTSGATSAPSQH
jgi:two-component system chemotaxis response regulator CheB